MHPQLQHPAVSNYIITGVEHYVNEGKKLLNKGASTVSVVAAIIDVLDEELNKIDQDTMKKISCRRGCSACCHIQVDMTIEEAWLAAMEAADNNIEIDKERLKDQATFKDENDYTAAGRERARCVFLKDNECSIYERRPMGCRKYLVMTPPENCDPWGPNGVNSVASHFNLDVEIAVSGAANLATDRGSMPQMLLKVLETGNLPSSGAEHL
jgi:Fe-S-cluster containining protein